MYHSFCEVKFPFPLSDFDLMMEQQKAMRRRRRKKDIDLINDNDDAIAKMIADMRLAAREDREKNADRQPATKKISMLPGKDIRFLGVSSSMNFEISTLHCFTQCTDCILNKIAKVINQSFAELLFISSHSALSAF